MTTPIPDHYDPAVVDRPAPPHRPHPLAAVAVIVAIVLAAVLLVRESLTDAPAPDAGPVVRQYATAYHHARDQCTYVRGGTLTTIHGYRDEFGRLYWWCAL